MQDSPILSGASIRLEPMAPHHADALAAAAASDTALYQWSLVPQTKRQAAAYVEAALAWRAAGTAMPFVIVNRKDETIIGSTRFWNIERWAWPPAHSRHGRSEPDACEIGYTWLARSAIRTAANTEAKLLLLTYAFETWRVFRVCFHTDARNQRSRAALERIGGKFEGFLRAHRMAADFVPRDSARYSIIAAEWPEVKLRILERLKSSGQKNTPEAPTP